MLPTISSAQTSSRSLDFELAGKAGFVKLSDLPAKPTLINFWRYDCPECVHEMPLIADVAAKLQVITIAVHKPSETLLAPAAMLKELHSAIIQLYAPTQPNGLLARFGDAKQALPHSVILNSKREVCAVNTGGINQEWINQAIARCD